MSWFIDVVSSLGVLGMSTGGWLSFSQESKVKNTIGSKHSFFMKGLFKISKIKTFITAYKNCFALGETKNDEEELGIIYQIKKTITLMGQMELAYNLLNLIGFRIK